MTKKDRELIELLYCELIACRRFIHNAVRGQARTLSEFDEQTAALCLLENATAADDELRSVLNRTAKHLGLKEVHT